jgi:hypothetical protein
MPKIDKTGLAWGVLFAVLVNGIYNDFVSLLQEHFQDVVVISIATFAVALIVIFGFRKVLFPEDYERKTSS